MKRQLLLTCAAVSSLAHAVADEARNVRPNIIFILCDDLGYGDLACYGQPFISTPCIDRMTREGVRFTQAYAGSPVSAPSRATIMTGQHTGHTHVRGNREYWPGSPTVMYGDNADYAVAGQEPYDPNHVVLTELMKRRGYATGVFGKWAGGYEGSCSTPDKRGVDEFYGYICQYQAHLYYPNFLNRYSRMNGDTAVVREVLEDNIRYPMYGSGYERRSQYSARLIHERAMQWLESQDGGRPFFGFFTYTLPHAELAQPHDSIVRHYESEFVFDKRWGGNEGSRYNPVRRTHAQFAAMVTRLDMYVGEIFDLLRAKGLDKNTVVVFSSDNGPHEEGGADPLFFGRDGKLRGLKRQCYEGGIRVPFIVWWPGHVAPATESDLQIAFYDILPTFCDIADMTDGGADKAVCRDGDGVAGCRDGQWAVGCRETHVGECGEGHADGSIDGLSFLPALLGNHKGQPRHDHLYWEFHETDQIAVRMGDWKMVVVQGVPRLYDLSVDIHEDHDVSSEHPDIVRRLVDIVRSEHVDSPLFKVTLP